MKRYKYLSIILLITALYSCNSESTTGRNLETTSNEIITVRGGIPADSLGRTLIHEHVFLDWTGADSIQPKEWNNEEAFEVILPYLESMQRRDVRSFLECTPAYLGRNPNLLKRLSEETGIHILTNTGFYGARQNKYIPKFAFEETAEQLAQRWVEEFENGIDGTGIRPGFIKIAVDSENQLSEMHLKLARAAAKTHLFTGLTIVSHTGTDTAAAQQLVVLEEEGVTPDAFVWTHAQRGTLEGHIRLAKRGTWVSLDGLGYVKGDGREGIPPKLQKYVDALTNLKINGLLHRTLISHDAGWYTHGKGNDRPYTPYTALFDNVQQVLRDVGFTDEDFYQLLVENPKEAYHLHVRKRS